MVIKFLILCQILSSPTSRIGLNRFLNIDDCFSGSNSKMIINKFFNFIFLSLSFCLIFTLFIFALGGSFFFTLLFLHFVEIINVVWEIAKFVHFKKFVNPLSPFILHLRFDDVLFCSLNVLFDIDFFLFKLFFILLLDLLYFLSLLLSFASDFLINLTLLDA